MTSTPQLKKEIQGWRSLGAMHNGAARSRMPHPLGDEQHFALAGIEGFLLLSVEDTTLSLGQPRTTQMPVQRSSLMHSRNVMLALI